MNPLTRPGQGAILDKHAAVGWTTKIPAQAHIGYGPAVGWLINVYATKDMIPTGYGHGYIQFHLFGIPLYIRN